MSWFIRKKKDESKVLPEQFRLVDSEAGLKAWQISHIVSFYSKSRSSVPCEFEDYLKIEFHVEWLFEYCFVICLRPIRMLLWLSGAYEGLQ